MLLEMIMLIPRTIDYLTKAHCQEWEFSWQAVNQGCPRHLQNIIGYCSCPFCLPEFEHRTLLVKVQHNSDAHPGEIKLNLTWKHPTNSKVSEVDMKATKGEMQWAILPWSNNYDVQQWSAQQYIPQSFNSSTYILETTLRFVQLEIIIAWYCKSSAIMLMYDKVMYP